MRDLNHLYADFIIETTLRERRKDARMMADLKIAQAQRPHVLTRLVGAIRALRGSTTEPACEPVRLADPHGGTAA